MMELRGVLSSWLIVVRNSLLARLDVSAAIFAWIKLFSDSFILVRSTKLSIRWSFPESFTGITDLSIGIFFPFLSIKTRSDLSTVDLISVMGHFPFSAGQMKLWHKWPIICSLGKPISSSAIGLTSAIVWVFASIRITPLIILENIVSNLCLFSCSIVWSFTLSVMSVVQYIVPTTVSLWKMGPTYQSYTLSFMRFKVIRSLLEAVCSCSIFEMSSSVWFVIEIICSSIFEASFSAIKITSTSHI